LIQELYKFWSLSSFTNPLYEKNKPYVGGNEVIAYDDKKILGFHTNTYNLDFITDKSRLKVKVTKDEVVFKESKYSRRPQRGIVKVDVGVYNLFQPITLMDVPKESEVKIPTNIIPAFYLKAVHDKNTWSNVDKGIWLGVDVATTLTGIGNLAKLRHLRHLGKLKKLTPLIRVKTAVSVVEVFSGTLNIMLTLADSKSPFAQKLQTYLFWLEMLSLGADVVVEKLLKNSARDLLKVVDDTVDESIIRHLAEIGENLDDYSRRFAKSLSKAEDVVSAKIKKFENEIKDYGEFRKNKEGKFEKVDLEHGMILNNAKDVSIKHVGPKFPNYIDWNYVPDWQFKGSILTHNHPSSSGLSLTDIETFLHFELQEVRAVGKNGEIFSMKNINIDNDLRDNLLDIIKKERKFAKGTFPDAGGHHDSYVFLILIRAMKNNVEYIRYID
jgi:hypothetical protein